MIVCHVHANVWGGLNWVSDSLEMDLLLAVSTVWVLGTQLSPSEKMSDAFKH